jgi:DNA-binding NtrC family response regulator
MKKQAETGRKPVIAVVEDDENLRLLMSYNIRKWGYTIIEFSRGDTFLEQAQSIEPDAIILDVMLPGMHGTNVLQNLAQIMPNVPVLVVSGQGRVDIAVSMMQLGAYDYLVKPVDTAKLEISLRNAVHQYSLIRQIEELKQKQDIQPFEGIISESPEMKRVFEMMQRVKDTDIAVMIQGETGTGKELIARALHYSGKRKDKPFIALNCASIPRELLESELFGHEKGAFTGAVQKKLGRLEQADGGSVFLDEIAEMEINLQAKLLRFLQTKTFERIGGNKTISIDVRIISATHQNLVDLSREGRFREDLYYRLAAFPLFLPPLRERGSDILLLAQHFLQLYATRYGRQCKDFTRKALKLLMNNPWKGNIRQLESAVEHAVILSNGLHISDKDLPASLSDISSEIIPSGTHKLFSGRTVITIDTLRKEAIKHALTVTEGNIHLAAEQLGISRATMYRLMQKFGIET